MPRTIASDIGSRTLSIEDAADNWAAGTNALPNGHFGLAMGTTPDTYSYAHDRVGDGVNYNFRAGQPRTINFWYRGTQGSSGYILGCGRQNSSSIAATNVNWAFYASGNTLYAGVASVSGTFRDALIAVASTAGWRMITVVWNPSSGTYGGHTTYLNGTQADTTTLTNTVATITPSELSIGAKATLSLSSLNPTAAVVAPMEIAKLAVFDTMLTAQNIADLYIAMLSP